MTHRTTNLSTRAEHIADRDAESYCKECRCTLKCRFFEIWSKTYNQTLIEFQ